MKGILFKVVSILLVVFMFGSILTGCSTTKSEGQTPAEGKNKQTVSTSTLANGDSQESVYPINTNETLTYWTTWTVHKDYKSPEEQPFFKELEKETGVKVKWIFAGTGDQVKQNFNLMVASGDLPDIIMYDWLNTPGGPESYIKNKNIIALNDVFKNYAPNLSQYLNDHTDISKMIKTDEGNNYCFPFVRGDKYLTSWAGPVVRKDWLDDIGMNVPETMDEWHAMLKAFKEKKGATAPVTWQDYMMVWSGQFMGAYGVIRDYYLEDGKIIYGPVQSGYKEAMKTLAAWYKEGLIDKDIATVDSKIQSERMISGQSGALIGSGGTIGTLLPLLKEKNPEADLVGAKYPVTKKGDIPKFGLYDNLYIGTGGAAITTACKNVELAAKLLDFSYSEQGHLLYNFGIEGESYTMVNGKPTYTEEMYKYQGDLGTSISRYIMSISQAPCIQEPGMYEQRMQYQQQKDALVLFGMTDAAKYELPPLTQKTDESQEMAKLSNDIDTYVKEMYFKFLLGAESLDKFDEYVNNVNKMGLERVISLKEAALKRYNAR